MKIQEPILELEELKLTSSAKVFLKETSKWAFFLSILGFIGIAFLVLLAVFSTTIFESMQAMQPDTYPEGLGFILTGIYLFFAILFFFPNFYLFKFSNKMKLAISSKNDDTLTEAFQMLKSHYKFVGVFSIISISIYAILIIFSISGLLI